MAEPLKLAAGAEAPPLPDPQAAPPTVSTLAALGHQLPIGYLLGEQLHRGLAFRKYTTRTERELDELRNKSKAQTNVEWVTTVLARMVSRWGPYDFDALGEHERRLVILQSWMPDVMFALLVFRRAVLGSTVKMDLVCGRCRTEFRAPIELDTIEVRVPSSPAALARRYRLQDGIEVRGVTYRDLVIDPPRWAALNTRTPAGAIAELTIAIAHGAIRHAVPDTADGAPVVVPIDSFDDVSKYDFEHLRAFVDAEHFGADLDLVSECPVRVCGFETHHGLDWTWDFFFRAASL